MKIKIYTKTVYGRKLHYPMCEISAILVQLGKRKDKTVFCFTAADLKLIRRLGIEIEEV